MRKDHRVMSAYGSGFPECNPDIGEILDDLLSQDLGVTGDLPYGAIVGDITSEAVLRHNRPVYGVIKSKEEGILAGLEEVTEFYARHGVQIVSYKQDGELLRKGEVIAELYSNEKEFLKVERTGLNILQRMSGVATATKKLADIAAPYDVQIVGTRKTLMNCLDKKAIYVGGGLPHRSGLHDAILIKDNHLEAIRQEGREDAIETALERAYTSKYRYNSSFIEVEVSTLEDAVKAANKFKEITLRNAEKFFEDPLLSAKEKYEYVPETTSIIMLDNMKPKEIKKVITSLKKEKIYDYVLLEASGRITEKNIKNYAKTGVDAISIGCITHSVKALDISQKIVRREK